MEAQDQAPVSGFFRLNGLNPGPSGKILQNVSQDHEPEFPGCFYYHGSNSAEDLY